MENNIMNYSKVFIQNALHDAEITGAELPRNHGICKVDSRLIEENDIFIALKGECQDGHSFVKHALEKGAKGLILSREHKQKLQPLLCLYTDICIVYTDDTYQALIQLAKAWRAQFSYPVLGITGSVGKTSTRHMLCNILKAEGRSYCASYGNYNTVIGLCLSLLKMNEHHDVAVFEMGISKRGEMKLLADIARPTNALITCIAHSHMQGLGSLSDIASEKRDIFSCFEQSNIGIINGDQDVLAQYAYAHPVARFGSKTTNQIQARKVKVRDGKTSFTLKLYNHRYSLTMNTVFKARVDNALAAASAASMLNVSDDAIIKGIQEDLFVPSRFECKRIKDTDNMIIDDCYNANPESMKAALTAFNDLNASGKKIAVIGDMLELGVNTPFWHRQIGRFLRKTPSINYVILVGEHVAGIISTLPVNVSYDHVQTWNQAYDVLKEKMNVPVSVLVKGSHGIQLHNMVKALT
jgi:UDP-N-acetylmuramoyl-tripeptide--D-alanyl-D-alanine ligase